MLSFFLVHAQDVDGGWSSCMVDGIPTLKCLEVVFANILKVSTGLFFLALFVMFIIGSFNYLTSLGNPEKIKKAQGTMKFAVIGLVIFLSSYLILTTIDYLFLGGNGTIFNFEIPN